MSAMKSPSFFVSARKGASKDVAVGPLQYECLLVMWRIGPANVHAVREELNGARERAQAKPIAYTTVLTVLRNMERRGVCLRVSGGQGAKGPHHHVYRPARSHASFLAAVARDFLAAYFDGDIAAMTTALKETP